MKPADSYYAASCVYPDRYPPLMDDIETDTCIIGGGLAGVCTALSLAEADTRAVLLEAKHIGFGASGRNGGQVIQDYACGMDKLEQLLGAERAGDLWRWSGEAVDLVEQRVRRYAIDCDWQRGYATVAVKPQHMAALQQWRDTAAQRYGYHGYTEWDHGEVCRHIGSNRYCGALYDTDSGHLHPLNYTLGLAKAAAGQGALLFEQTPAVKLRRQEGLWRVETPQGSVVAQHVVLAVNTFPVRFGFAAADQYRSRYILPVGTYVIATEPLGEWNGDILPGNIAACDTRYVLDYYRKSADGRLLFGGKVNYRQAEPDAETLRRSMRQDMLKVFPQLAEVDIDFVWGGRVDISMNRAPDFRRIGPELYLLQGFSGHGVALTGLAGQVCSEAILGREQRWQVFESIAHRAFPGGILRQPAQMAGLAWHRFLDLL